METLTFYTSKINNTQIWAEDYKKTFDKSLLKETNGIVKDSYIPKNRLKNDNFKESDRIYFCELENGNTILVPKKLTI